MGNLFSAHFRPPPFDHRRSRRQRRSLSITIGSASRNTVIAAVDVESVTPMSGRSTNPHQPVSAAGSSSSDRSRQPSLSRVPVTNSQIPRAKKRKPSLKMTLKRAYAGSVASQNVFTEERRLLVSSSWQEITEKLGKFETARRIFENLFHRSPAIRATFGVESEDFDLEHTFSVARHIHVFGNVLDLAVRNVLELEAEIGPTLLMFGRRHFFKHRVDFRNDYLILFGQSISDVVHTNLSETYVGNVEVTIAWRLFISYLIKKIKEGYEMETLQTRK